MKNGKAHVETWLYREVETSQDSIGKFVLTDLYFICSNCELCMPPTDFAAWHTRRDLSKKGSHLKQLLNSLI